MKRVGASIFFCLITMGFTLTGCNSDSSKTAQPKLAEVDVALPLKKTIVDWDEYTGRFQPVEEVNIRARVTGYLMDVKFQDGQVVQKGETLFIIDPRPFQYALNRAQAQYTLSETQYQRAQKLQKEKFIPAEVIDQRFQDMQVAQTRLEEAKLNLEFTEVKSPITGKISRHFVSVGNLIRMNDTILTRIVSIDPIHFYFEINQTNSLKYSRLGREESKLKDIKIKLADEKDYMHTGKIDFQDNIIDFHTGTLLARALIPNPKGLISPGLFGRVKLVGSKEYEALLLPDVAINTDQTRQFVYVVDKAHEAKRVYVELGPLQESGFYIIRSGLKGNEWVAINGIQRIQAPNQKVNPEVIKLIEKKP